jgi:hypothetical protein
MHYLRKTITLLKCFSNCTVIYVQIKNSVVFSPQVKYTHWLKGKSYVISNCLYPQTFSQERS